MPTNKDAVLASIELIADSPDTAAEVIDEKIEFLKAELQRYFSLRKMVCKKTPSSSGCGNASPEKLKAVADVVVKVLQAAKKPMSASEISDKINKLGFSYSMIGRCAASDSRLKKEGKNITLA